MECAVLQTSDLRHQGSVTRVRRGCLIRASELTMTSRQRYYGAAGIAMIVAGATCLWLASAPAYLTEVESLSCAQSGVRALAFLHDNRFLITGNDRGYIEVFDRATSARKSIKAHDGWVNCIVSTTDGAWLVSGGGDGIVKIWDPGSWKPLHSLRCRAAVIAIAVCPNGRSLLVGTDTGGYRYVGNGRCRCREASGE